MPRTPRLFENATLLVLLATTGLAFKGIVARFAYEAGLTVLGVVILRVAFATPLFWVGGHLLRSRAPAPAPVPRRVWIAAVACGALFLLSAFCDFAAIARIGAGPSRVVLFSYPALVLLFESLRDRRAPRLRHVATFVVAWTGIALVALPATGAEIGDEWTTGIAYALVCAVSYALFLVTSQPIAQRIGSVGFTVASSVGTALALVVALPFLATPADFAFTTEGTLWLGLLSVTCTVLPFFMLFEGIRRSNAAITSLLALVGPPITLAAAWVLLDERLTATQFLGAGFVLAGVAILKWPSRPRPA